jgi:hypothetical protein
MCIACKDYIKDRINRKEWEHNWRELNEGGPSEQESSSPEFIEAIHKYFNDTADNV